MDNQEAGNDMARQSKKKPTALFLSALTLALISMGFTAPAQAQSDDWEVVLAPYAWIASITGDAAIGRTDPAPVDVSFSDLLENLRFGFMLHGEVRKGAWGVMLDAFYVKLGSDLSTPLGGVLDLQVQVLVFEALLSRRFDLPRGSVDAYAGIRYWDVDLDVELEGVVSGAIDRGDSWVDPVVGGRVIHYVGDDWFVMLRGDIGGFGVGSNFSWTAAAGVGYEVSDLFSIVAQYKALDVDFENDAAGTPDFLLFDAIVHGPLVGFVFRF